MSIVHKVDVAYSLGRESMVAEQWMTHCLRKNHVMVDRTKMANMESSGKAGQQFGCGKMRMQADIDFVADNFRTKLSADCRLGRRVAVAAEGLELHCKLLVSRSCADHMIVMAAAVNLKLGRQQEHRAGDHSNHTSWMGYCMPVCYTGTESGGSARGRRMFA